jgi:hypothetical protein
MMKLPHDVYKEKKIEWPWDISVNGRFIDVHHSFQQLTLEIGVDVC